LVSIGDMVSHGPGAAPLWGIAAIMYSMATADSAWCAH
jgi:hypothetical protein